LLLILSLAGPLAATGVRDEPPRSRRAVSLPAVPGAIQISVDAGGRTTEGPVLVTIVFRNGVRRPVSPHSVVNLPPGTYTVEVARGRLRLVRKVDVTSGRTVRLSFRLPSTDPCRVSGAWRVLANSRVTIPLPCRGRRFRLGVVSTAEIDVFVVTPAQIRSGQLASFRPVAGAAGVRNASLIFSLPAEPAHVIVLDNSAFPGDRPERGFTDASVSLESVPEE
jgi:hypothetical protein